MPTLSNITAAILAGGMGTRLRSVVADRPKGLALIKGRPFLAWQLDQLAAAGIRRAVLCTGYMADQMQATLGTQHGPIALSYSQETTPLGTGGAIRLAAPHLTSDPVLILNGDSYTHANFPAFLQFHLQHSHAASMFLTQVPDISRYGQVLFDKQNRVTRFAEKSAPTSSPTPGQINAGIYLVPPTLIAGIPEGRPVSLEKEAFPALIPDRLFALPTQSPFIDIGTPESYAAAEAFLAALS